MEEKSGRGVELLVLIMASVALIIMVVGGIWTLSPDDGGMGGQGHGGSGDETSSFPVGTALFIFGGLLFIILLFAGILLRSRRVAPAPQPIAATQAPQPVQVSSAPQMPSQEAQKLAIKLLSGDERKMFRRIVEGGGEVLQKDLVAEGKFSKAKVTRLLDKLERKDLIVRSRYGSTNKVRVSENLGK